MIRKINKVLFILVFIFITGCDLQNPDYLQGINPIELNKIIQNENIYLVDVHIPQQRHIKGTDLFVPYNEIEKYKDRFPKDKNTVIYLYCEGGPMGKVAARSLHELGYSKLINLEGGTNAWQRAGFKVE